MNDNDLTDMMETICSDWWDSRIMLDGRTPWSEQTVATKNQLKENVLPWIFRAAPLLQAKAHELDRRFIEQARAAEVSDSEIIDLLLSV